MIQNKYATGICSGIFSFIWLIALLRPYAWASDAPGHSHPADANAYQLEEIVVSATREKTPQQDVAADITVITQDEIEKMPATTAAEVLQYIPGVYVEFNGGVGTSAFAQIQGSDIRHVAVYEDGVPLNLLANPMTDLSYIPVDAIDRIEVYKGAASSAWGSSLGGVINIITKEPDPLKPVTADVRASYGEAETSTTRGTVSGTIDRYGYLLSLTHDRSDGFIDDSAYDQKAVYAKFNYDIGTVSRVNVAYSYDDGNNQDPVLDYPDFWDDIHQERSYQRLLFETFPADGLGVTIEGRHQHYDGLIEDVYVDHREIFNDYSDESWGSSARINYRTTQNNALNIGFDGDWGRYDWQNYVKEYNTGNWALYTNDTYNWNKFSFNAGVRSDHNQDFGSEISPSAGLVYRISGSDALIRAQIAKGFSAPPPAFVHDPNSGNPDLKPETAVNYQLGGDMKIYKFLRTQIKFFRADVKDLIRFDPDRLTFFNIDKVIRQGVEGVLSTTFDFGLSLSFSGEFTNVKDQQTNEIIKDIPRVQYNVTAAYTYKWITQTLYGKYIDHNSSYPETQDKRFIFDYVFNVKPPRWNRFGQTGLYCTVHNIFNTPNLYREVWPQPDRWVEAGLRFVY